MTKNRFDSAAVDVQLGLRHCHGRSNIYRQILEHFVEQYASLPALKAFQAQPAEEIIRWLHTLRGHCATIGATALSIRVRELQQDWPDLTAAELETRWNEISNSIQGVIGEARQYIQLYQGSN